MNVKESDLVSAFEMALSNMEYTGTPKMDEPSIWADGRWWTPREFVKKYGTKK